MWNLVLSDQSCREISVDAPGLFCVDAITGSAYHANTEALQTLKLGNTGSDSSIGFLWEDYGIKTSWIVKADVITASNTICVVAGEGDVVTVNKDTQEVEVVGSVCAGIHAACWSPDQELLILVTGETNMVVMTADFDPIIEYSLNQDDFGENKFINVGWGKKETQFHGTEGKDAAKAVKHAVKPVSQWDDHMPRISWRGDGQVFVVSFVTNDTHSRRLRIISREGILQYTSEDVDGLEQAISWKPSGSVIASSQRLPNKHEIVFFEKNGLKHGEFNLPFKPNEVIVKEVAWNQDSSILLVWLEPFVGSVKRQTIKHVIQLWTVGNYHWYLKQELNFTETVQDLFWDTENPFLLYVLTLTHLHHYRWVVTPTKSLGFGPLDLAQVAVIDGKKLLITPFRQSVIPPPMSAYEVTFTEQINAAMFAPPIVRVCEVSPNNSQCVEDSGFLEAIDPPGCNSNSICVFHGSETLTFLTQAHADDILDDHGCDVKITGAGGNGFIVKVKVHRVIAQLKIEWDPKQTPDYVDVSKLCSWVWAAKNTLLASYTKEEEFYVVIIDLHAIGSETGRVTIKAVLPVENSVVSISPASDGTVAALQLITGALLKLNLLTNEIKPFFINGVKVKFPNVCQQVSLCSIDDASKVIPLGLTCRNRLYWGNNQLLTNCTSYHIHTDHLLVTTTNHMLLMLPLMESYLNKLVSGRAEDCGVVGSRKVERGSRIVTAVPQDTRVVLQMPRGNLELVSPRPLAVHTLKQLLNEHKYHQAIDVMRKQRIDLNLVYDHDPDDFLKHITQFVQNVDNPHWIDLFIASLSENDVTNTTYSFNYNNQPQKHDSQALGSKIDVVCKAVREAMISVDEERFLLPILTSYVKMTVSQMEVALKKIQEMKDAKDRKFKVSAEEGLRHLLYIADVDELYDVALGTYDFDLVMMVAEKSQKDPKEYLPFLNELKMFGENYRKFKINVHLRRFERALECLRDSENHTEECLYLIVSEKLYKEALQIFPLSSRMNKAICERYGSYLMAKQYYNEAAVMYTRANKLDDALNAYQKAGNWKMILVVGAQLKFNNEEMNVLCCNLVESLKNRNNYVDAAWIYEEYLKNEEEALDCLVKGSQWDDALRVAYKYRRLDLVDTNIKPGAEEQYLFCIAEIDRLMSIFTQYCSRLAVVRETKEKQHFDLLDGNCESQLDCDLYSDTSTVTGISHSRSYATGSRTGTSVTGKTFRSSKNKKKLERKKFSTKEGGAYEDLGLVSALHELLSTANGMATSVTALCTILVTFGMDRESVHLQSNFSSLVTLMDRKKAEIWPASVPLHEEEPEFGPELTTEGVVNRIRGGSGDVSFVAQRMRELDPPLRHPPPANNLSNWSLHILRQDR